MLRHAVILGGLLALTACGQMKLSPMKNDTPGQATGEMKVQRTPALPSFSLNRASRCHLDEAKRTLSVTIEGDKPKGAIDIEIVGLRSFPSEYSCEQGQGNNVKKESLGTPFDGCMMRASVPAQLHPGAVDVHSTCRTDIHQRLFSYGSRCKVMARVSEEKIEGTFSCAQMPRVISTNAPSADDDDATIDIDGSFQCIPDKNGR